MLQCNDAVLGTAPVVLPVVESLLVVTVFAFMVEDAPEVVEGGLEVVEDAPEVVDDGVDEHS